jgi:hypothetical protein
MSQITINIPDVVISRVLNAICATSGYNPDSGLTKAQFAKNWLIGNLKNAVINYETQIRNQTINDDINSSITIT